MASGPVTPYGPLPDTVEKREGEQSKLDVMHGAGDIKSPTGRSTNTADASLLTHAKKMQAAGRWRAVERCAQQLRVAAQARDDSCLETEAMLLLGTSQTRQGRFVTALESLAFALQHAQRQTDVAMLCKVLVQIAYANAMLGHLEEALNQNSQAVFLARRMPGTQELLPLVLAQHALFLAKRARQHRQQGRPMQSQNDLQLAQQHIVRATSDHSQTVAPELLLRVQEVHFELLMAQKKLSSARGLLRLIESSSPTSQCRFERRRRIVMTLLGAWLLLEGDFPNRAMQRLSAIRVMVQRSRDFELERLFLILAIETCQRLNRWQAAFGALTRLRELDGWRHGHQIDVARQRLNAAIQETRQDSLQLVAHDLRHPLSNAMLISESLHRSPHVAEVRTQLNQLRSQVERASAVSDQFLRHARLEQTGASDFTWVNMGELLDELALTWELSAQALNVTLCTDINFDVMVRGDRILLASAVENLMSNALKVSPSGAQVRLHVRRTGLWCLVRVGDHGPGIAATSAKQSRDPLVGMQQPHGWGLHSVRRTAALHGGLLWFEPAEPHGTWAHLLLPAQADTVADIAASHALP